MLSPTVTPPAHRARGRGRPAGVRGGPCAPARDRLDQLSDREREVALAVGRGSSNAQIGAELYLSVATVKAHVSRLLVKLDVAIRVQMVLLMHDADLV
jgi:DNA-binding NarL/FixJ family response regulator